MAADSFRGIGAAKALALIGDVSRAAGLPALTDIHLPEEAAAAVDHQGAARDHPRCRRFTYAQPDPERAQHGFGQHQQADGRRPHARPQEAGALALHHLP